MISTANGGWVCAEAVTAGSGITVTDGPNGPTISADPIDSGVAALQAEVDSFDASVKQLNSALPIYGSQLTSLQQQITGLDGSVGALKTEADGLTTSVTALQQQLKLIPQLFSSDVAGTLVLRDGTGSFAANSLLLDGDLQLGDGGISINGAPVFQEDLVLANLFVGVGAPVRGVGELNTALGAAALSALTTGDSNTALGAYAMQNLKNGGDNVAVGVNALQQATGANLNTAVGYGAMQQSGGSSNVAVGTNALAQSPTGSFNVAVGGNTLGLGSDDNVALGYQALQSATGSSNTAVGYQALRLGGAGQNNTAVGYGALQYSTGSNNIAIGYNAGINVDAGSNNIEIGNPGLTTDNNVLRIGQISDGGTGVTSAYIAGISGVNVAGGVAVVVNAAGQLGVTGSSRRFKRDICDIGDASQILMKLRPVAFKYRPEIDPEGQQQYGLIAEEVEQVAPELVAYDAEGQLMTVRYNLVNALLLNEVQQLHRESDAQRIALRQQAADDERETRALLARLDALEKQARR